MRVCSWLLMLAVALAGFRAAADEPVVPRDLAIDIVLTGGGHVHGSAAAVPLALRTEYGPLRLPLSRAERLSLDENGETVTCRMRNGDVLHGVLETDSLELFPLGEAGARKVLCRDLRSLRVVPPIRIAGSEGAWWEVAFRDADGWTMMDEAGRLVVTGIDPVTVFHGNEGAPSQVRLTREVDVRGDFELDADLSWSADGAGLRAMHNLYVSLLDPDGRLVASAGHNDAWVGETGSRYSRVAGHDTGTGWNTVSANGRTELRFVRENGCLMVLFDGVKHDAGEAPGAIGRVQVDFEYYPYDGPGGRSSFGTLTLDRLAIR